MTPNEFNNLPSGKITETVQLSNNDIKDYMVNYAYLTMKMLEQQNKIRQYNSQLRLCESDKARLRIMIRDAEAEIRKIKDTVIDFLEATFWNDENRNKIIIDFMQGDHFYAIEVRRLTRQENERTARVREARDIEAKRIGGKFDFIHTENGTIARAKTTKKH